jgi:hypothetical protein
MKTSPFEPPREHVAVHFVVIDDEHMCRGRGHGRIVGSAMTPIKAQAVGVCAFDSRPRSY